MKKEKDTRDVSLSIGREEKPCEDTNEEETVYKPGRQASPKTNADGILTLHFQPPELKK